MSQLNAKTYLSDQFGYLQLDEFSHSVDIFKICDKQRDRVVNIAKCSVMDTTDRSFVIDNHRSLLKDATNMTLIPSYLDGVDSLTVTVKALCNPPSECMVFIQPDYGNIMAKKFDKDGIAIFKIKKHAIDYRNVFSIWIQPNVNPFKCSTSWGDNETLSYVELPIYNHSTIFDSSISGLEIILPDFSDVLFSKWVIVDDIVLKTEEGLIWRGLLFTEDNVCQ